MVFSQPFSQLLQDLQPDESSKLIRDGDRLLVNLSGARACEQASTAPGGRPE
jgi:hypothetical protein